MSLGGASFTSLTPIGGGDLSATFRAELDDGRVVFLKRSGDASFAAEAAGLDWLRGAVAAGGPPVPEVLGFGEDFLCLSWIETGGASSTLDGEAFGRALAALHRCGAPRWGALPPGAPAGGVRIGPLSLPLPERPRPDGRSGHPNARGFLTGPETDGTNARYSEHFSHGPTWSAVHGAHLSGLAARAAERSALSPEGHAAIERVVVRLGGSDDLGGAADERPARLHGDLWSGNALAGADGRGWLIDPAAYGGHREVDLAMMRLFGGFSAECFAAYDEAFPLSTGWQDRVELYQLLPLLVHAVLFGGGYGARAAQAAERYAG